MSQLLGNQWVLMLPAFLLVISLIVFIHEMGHYLVGRWSGIRILAFSFGFGPELWGYTDKHGTRWKVSAIPLGGYVRFYGDADAASTPDFDAVNDLSPAERARTFTGAKLWKRALTVAAGPLANFLLAVVILTGIFSVYGRYVADPVVAQVTKDSAAERAGIIPGDLLLRIDGNVIETFDEIQRYVSIRPSVPMTLTVKRGGEEINVPLTPKLTEITDRFGNKIELGIIGIATDRSAGNMRVVTFTPLAAVGEAVRETGHIVTGTFRYVGNIFAGRMKPDQLGGPIAVAQAAGQVATLGIIALLHLAAVLSVSIGLLNLMPVPVLDGGHLMFYAVEALRGKPVGEAAQGVAFRIGMFLVLSLMVFVTWNDITRNISSWVG
jgi:regulator of sigma E protease